jgi:acyl carrier protein
MNSKTEVIGTLRSVLNLGERSTRFELSTPLLGAIPELDSMAVVSLLTSLEERFGFTIEDDEVDGKIFATVGSLVAFVDSKLQAQ